MGTVVVGCGWAGAGERLAGEWGRRGGRLGGWHHEAAARGSLLARPVYQPTHSPLHSQTSKWGKNYFDSTVVQIHRIRVVCEVYDAPCVQAYESLRQRRLETTADQCVLLSCKQQPGINPL